MRLIGVRRATSFRFTRVTSLGLAAMLTLLTAGTGAAQEFRGTLLGRVTDQQGGAIPHATVVVTNEGTNVPSEALTEADGAYTVPFLIPGTYRVEVALTGFKKFVRSGVTVGVTQHVTVDARLELGEMTEVVEVRAEASLLDRASGSLGQTIDVTQVEDTPLNGRNPFMLNRDVAGVNWNATVGGNTGTSGLRPFDNSGISNWSMNGGRTSTNEFLLDGAPNSTRGRYNFAPPVDAVEEIKVQTNTYDAQYGRTGGGVVNMTLKSGTNELHGQAFEFLKNDIFNANAALNVEQGKPKPPNQSNQYGFVVRGPVIRNRTFFMGTFEGLRERVPFPNTTSVPTEAERRGDFSQSYSDQRTPLDIYDPLTTRPDPSRPGQFIRDQFSCNGVKNVICPDRINPISLKILNSIYPLPNVPGQRLNNYLNPVNKARYDYDSEIGRVDHKFSDSSKLFVSLGHNLRNEFRSQNGLQGTFANQGEWPQTRINRNAIADWVKTIGDHSLLNVRGGFTWFTEDTTQSEAKTFDRSTLGFVNLPGQYLPFISLQDHSNVGVKGDGRPTSDRTTSIQANFTRTLARQTLKAGGEYRYIENLPFTTGDYNGQFAFTRGFTQRDPNTNPGNVTGNSVASFLLGYPATNNGNDNSDFGGGTAKSEFWHYTALFVQDDFRASSKLTINAGLRWDYESAVFDAQNRLTRGFAFDQANPLAGQIVNRPGFDQCPACANLRGGLLFAGVNGVPRGLFDREPFNFQPRAGFAYSVNEKTVLRGGYGLYYSFRSQTGSQDGFVVTTPYIANDLGGRVGIPELTVNAFAHPFPNGPTPAPGSSLGLLTQVGRGISFDDPANKMPHIHQYNITVSREVLPSLLVELSYVGSQTRNIAVGHNLNGISAADLARGAADNNYLQQNVPNPFAGLLPGTTRNGATIQRQNLLTPYPEFGGITENAMAIGKGWYNSLQLVVQKRFSKDLSFLSSYTFSRTMEQASFLNDQDTQMVVQRASYDRPHVWNFTGTYALPIGRDKMFGRTMSPVLNAVVGGWQANWNFNWQSGRPLGTPGNTLEPLPGTSPVLAHPTADRWFNTCYLDTTGNLQSCLPGESPVWQQRPPFTLRTTPDRFADIREPWKPTLDASIFKRFDLPNQMRFELRLEAFNVTNTVIYNNPSTALGANFGRIVTPRGSAYIPRNMQVGFKLFF
jgi:hypothetical protein